MFILKFTWFPPSPRRLCIIPMIPPHWQSIFFSPHFTLCWWPSPPPPFTLKNHVTPPPIYFFNPLQRLEDMTLIFLSKSFPPPPPPRLNLSSFEQIWTILNSRDKDARGEDGGGLWFPQPLTLNLFARAFYSILLFSLEYGWKVFYISRSSPNISRELASANSTRALNFSRS